MHSVTRVAVARASAQRASKRLRSRVRSGLRASSRSSSTPPHMDALRPTTPPIQGTSTPDADRSLVLDRSFSGINIYVKRTSPTPRSVASPQDGRRASPPKLPLCVPVDSSGPDTSITASTSASSSFTSQSPSGPSGINIHVKRPSNSGSGTNAHDLTPRDLTPRTRTDVELPTPTSRSSAPSQSPLLAPEPPRRRSTASAGRGGAVGGDNDGRKMRHAAWTGDVGMLMAELQRPGTSVDLASRQNRTALSYTAERGHLHCLLLLMEAPGCNLDTRCEGGHVALHYAAREGREVRERETKRPPSQG
jgi:hypothetical protein